MREVHSHAYDPLFIESTLRIALPTPSSYRDKMEKDNVRIETSMCRQEVYLM